MTSHVMYLVLRRDLLTDLKWPLGALITQACHASTAILWTTKENSDTVEYMKNIDHMRKVLLEVRDEKSLIELSQALSSNNVEHKLWIEQPEGIPTCLAVKPCLKTEVHKYVKHLPLFA